MMRDVIVDYSRLFYLQISVGKLQIKLNYDLNVNFLICIGKLIGFCFFLKGLFFQQVS